jgi:hypothetical protein
MYVRNTAWEWGREMMKGDASVMREAHPKNSRGMYENTVQDAK